MSKKLLLTSVIVLCFTNVYAQNAPFNVTGNIAPSTCIVTLNGGGTAALGQLPASTVRGYAVSTSGTNLVYTSPLVNVAFNITCQAATKIGVAMLDNNSGKVLAQDSTDPVKFGLTNGTGTATIGSFKFYFGNVLIDNSNVWQALSAANGSTSWTQTNVAGTTYLAYYAAPGYTNAFSKTANGGAPDAFTTLTGNLAMTVSFGKTAVDSATSAIIPNGSGALTLVYL